MKNKGKRYISSVGNRLKMMLLQTVIGIARFTEQFNFGADPVQISMLFLC